MCDEEDLSLPIADRVPLAAAANNFLEYVAGTYGVQLTTDLAGLEQLDALISNLAVRANLLSRDDAGAFVGEVLIHEVDGRWVQDDADLVVSVSWTITDPYQRVKECLYLPAESLASYCRAGIEICNASGSES